MVGAQGLELDTYEAVGCENCGQTGYSGRCPVVEFAHLSSELKKVVLTRPDHDALAEQLQTEQMRTLWERGADLVETGLTTIDELSRVLGPVKQSPPVGTKE